jgi:hypothetical protein
LTPNRWIAIHTGAPHYLDHLGVLCMELGLLLYLTEPATFQTAKKFYPGLQCKLVSPAELSLDSLATHFDAIFESGHLWALELKPLFEMLHNKNMRIVYCPHGNSDKGYSQTPVPKDISLVYGSHMIDHLTKTKSPMNAAVVTGNYRYAHYRKIQKFYDDLLKEELGSLDPARKTIFYAPSWPDGENPTSFLESAERVIEEVGKFYNVIVRWHPFLDDLYPVETQQLLGKYEGRKGVVFLGEFPCIYPILNASDGYLGDFSSIGYDFLAFNRPLFFLDSHFGKLYACGLQLDLNSHFGKSMVNYRDTPQLQKRREELYLDAFGKERNGKEILEDLKEALSCDKASEEINYLGQEAQEDFSS